MVNLLFLWVGLLGLHIQICVLLYGNRLAVIVSILSMQGYYQDKIQSAIVQAVYLDPSMKHSHEQAKSIGKEPLGLLSGVGLGNSVDLYQSVI